MTAWVLNRRAELVIFALALLLRLAWVLPLANTLTWIDEHEFAAIGEHLAHGDGYVATSFRANPVLPAYLGLVFRLFGQNYMVARIGQSVLGALTCVLLYRIGAILIGQAVGFLSGLLLAVYPPHIYLAGVLYVDSWLTFFCALSVYLAALTLRARGRVGLAFLAGVSLGLMALTRGTFLVYVPCVCAAWLYGDRWGWRRLSLACLALLSGCALTILPWTVRNYAAYGHPILISSGFYTMLWRGNNPLATGGPDDRVFMWNTPAWYERLQSLPEDQRRALHEQYQVVDRLALEREEEVHDPDLVTDEVLRPLAIKSVTSDPTRTAVLMMKKVRTLFTAFSATESENTYTTWRNKLVAGVSFYPILVLALVGAWLGLPRRRELALIYLAIVSLVSAYALLTVCTRFRLPLDPYLILFASLAIVRLTPVLPDAWTARLRAGQGATGERARTGPPTDPREKTPTHRPFDGEGLPRANPPQRPGEAKPVAPRRRVGHGW